MSPSSLLGAAGVVLATGSWLLYLSLIPREKVPAKPHAFSAAMVAAIGLAAWSLWPSLSGAVPNASPVEAADPPMRGAGGDVMIGCAGGAPAASSNSGGIMKPATVSL